MTGQERGLRIAVLVFFLSGTASLADELIWFKYLSFTFGATTAAAATLVAVFMGGLALGSWLCGRLVSRITRPDLLYAVLETGVAVLALATPVFFSWIGHAYVAAYRHFGDGPGKLMLIRVLLSAVALLPPTVLMGATFPALARAVEGISRPGRRSTLLYGVNTAGAVVGVLACGFLLIPSIGLHATLVGSACVSLLGALLAAFSGFARPAPVSAERAAPRALWLFVAFVAGACAMADEVLWTRILVLHLGSSVYAFALMLATFLIGLVGGSLIGAALRSQDLRRSIGVAQLSFGFSILLQVFAFTGYSRTLVAVATSLLHVRTYGGVLLAEAVTTGLFLLPPTLLMGLSFALLLQAASRSAGTAPADVASVYAANTLGGIGGSLLAGFAAIPLIGSQNSLLLTGFLATSLALLLAPKSWLMRLAPGGFLLLCLLPARDAVIRSAGALSDVPAQDVIFLREDVTATVAVKRLGGARPSLSLELNGVNVAGSTPDNVVIQKLQAHLPLALCEDPKKILHIGLGSGGTAYSVSRHPVSEIRIAEISPEVAQAADRFFQGVNHGVLSDPRVHLTINDGRNFVLASPDLFDVILSDSIHPRYAGNGSLYTEDYFRLCARRLKPGGVISMWLPMYSLRPEDYRSIIRAFQDVFPNVSIWYPYSIENAFTIVLATADKTVRLEDLARRLADPAVAEDLSRIGAADPAELLSYLLMAPQDVARWVDATEPHTDDLPLVEYESGRILESTGTWATTFGELVARRSRIEEFVQGLSPEDPLSQQVLERFRESGPILGKQLRDVQARARQEP
jgi:spermidine synthase